MSAITVDDGTRLHYRVAGSGPALLFHPGFSNNLDLWNWVVRDLAPHRQCVTFDPRGHGASDKPDSAYTLAELGRDVVALTEQLGLRDVTLVGHSLGGAVSLAAVLDHDSAGLISRLALVSPALPRLLQSGDLDLGMPAEVFAGIQDGIANHWIATQQSIAKIFYHQTDEATGGWLAQQCLSMPVHIAIRYFSQLASIDYASRLHEVAIPVLVMWGAHDQIADPRWAGWFRSEVPGWHVEMLANSGHGSMIDEPALMAELLRKFTE